MDESNLKAAIAREQGKLEGCEREVVVIRRTLEEYTTESTSVHRPSMSAQELKSLLDIKLQEISASKVLIDRMKRAMGSQLYMTPTGTVALEPSISPVKSRLIKNVEPLLTPLLGPRSGLTNDTNHVSNSAKQMLELTDRIEKLSNRLVTSEREMSIAVDQLKLGITSYSQLSLRLITATLN